MALSKSESSTASERAGAAGALLEHTFRREAGRMVSHFARMVGPAHLQIAEDAVQEAMLRALQTWPYSGVPGNPSGWLFRVAHNAVIDALRQTRLHGEKAAVFVREGGARTGEPAIEERFQDDELRMIVPSPVIALNRAVAVAKVHGPAEALRTIELLDDHPKLKDYHLLLAVRGHLLRELGRWSEAAASYRNALRLECSEPERRFMRAKLEECESQY